MGIYLCLCYAHRQATPAALTHRISVLLSMKRLIPFFVFCILVCAGFRAGAQEKGGAAASVSEKAVPGGSVVSGARRIPAELEAWRDWATWEDREQRAPALYSDGNKRLSLWPTRLQLRVGATGGEFEFGVTMYSEGWVRLPGDGRQWPTGVTAGGVAVAVLEEGGRPALWLGEGEHRIAGRYQWRAMPQGLTLPPQIGLLMLRIEEKEVESPTWDANGFLWLKRNASSEEADKNFISLKLYAALEDGIPMWLQTEVELTVAGKSREEELGNLLPEGWSLAAVESPVPVAVDELGHAKAQVRAGKWTLKLSAFRLDAAGEVRFGAQAKPGAAEVLLAFRSRPELRTLEVMGAPSVDVSQTTFPQRWRELPVYRWETGAALRLEERMRGMGDQKLSGVSILRQLWLEEDGGGYAFRDRISGARQQTWRLDVAKGQTLGAVRSGGEGQLITRNPRTGATGVEVRARGFQLEATGRSGRGKNMSASGWETDTESVTAELNLPPGWRLFGLFGADWVSGDWLTAWTLLDVFLLLLLSLAVFKIWGFWPAVLAFLGFGLSYHEPGAPRYTWLVVLAPLLLERVLPAGRGRSFAGLLKWVCVLLLAFVLVPFLGQQVQQALYPQLERVGARGTEGSNGVSSSMAAAPQMLVKGEMAKDEQDVELAAVGKLAALAEAEPSLKEAVDRDAFQPGRKRKELQFSGQASVVSKAQTDSRTNSNLAYDKKARIQTGNAMPDWSWRKVRYGWNGPVDAGQRVRVVLISVGVERLLTVMRVGLLLGLAAVLLDVRRMRVALLRRAATVVLLVCALAVGTGQVRAEVPDENTLGLLRKRLLELPPVFPHAADIPVVDLALEGQRLKMEAEIHAGALVAVPLPGRLPVWSPLSVSVDGKPEATLRREDGSLWVVLSAGVHQVRVEALLAPGDEWQWAFVLKPRRVRITAPEWTVSGVRPSGEPEAQVFFVRKEKNTGGQGGYDRQELQAVARVERRVELGLVWQVRTTVRRLSPLGKAVSLRVPLLEGESVVSSGVAVKSGFVEVRLGAQESSYQWESSLPEGASLALVSRKEDAWVERWEAMVSPMWNVLFSGLSPTFEEGRKDLLPVWQPWPGERVELSMSRPEAVPGATVTVDRARHEVRLGERQRLMKLDFGLRCSLGEDFVLKLPEDAEITELLHNGKSIPARRDREKLVVPLRPGEQNVSVSWRTKLELAARGRTEKVEFPVEAANVETRVHMPPNRWVLWAWGPQRGPAVRFWGVLLGALLAGAVLGRLQASPLRAAEWMLLAVGLTQVPLLAALIVIGWFFLLVWRGGKGFQKLGFWRYNFVQLALLGATLGMLCILVFAVGEGLLGSPRMFIEGNGSNAALLQWTVARVEGALPQPGWVSVSVWWYRVAMLVWALWLALALIRWLRWAWDNFSRGDLWRPKRAAVPPTLP